ncbi:MAG: EAL domain-containing protein [Proteobacteria bacterium]|nr:EAL domain-containing protein [Pseudomonadota bacterium]
MTKYRKSLVEKIVEELGTGTLGTIGVAVLITDSGDNIVFFNDEAGSITGWSAKQAIGKRLGDVFRLNRKWLTQGSIRDNDDSRYTGISNGNNKSTYLVNRTGHRLAIRYSQTAIRDQQGHLLGKIIVFINVDMQHQAERDRDRRLSSDPLTELLNRQAFTKYLEPAVEESQKGDTSKVLCYINIDHFRLVNDSCGHQGGDNLLQWIATLLREEMGGSDVLARLNGDEFAILLTNSNIPKAQKTARSFQEKLRTFGFSWGDRSFAIRSRIGIISLSEVDSVDDLFFAADHACCKAREIGGSQIHIYQRADSTIRQRQLDMDCAAEMRRNLHGGRFLLFGQVIRPLVYEHSDRLHFEVLLRPKTETGELGSPEDVIRAAEHYGGMELLDRWVIRNTLQTLKKRMTTTSDRLDLCSINLSGISLQTEGLLEYIHEQIAESAIPPAKVCFEITETAAVNNLSKAQWLIEGVSAIGCRFALDDFGTGMASYGYLKDLPIDFLKIDGVFIKDIVSNSFNRTIVESINQIGHFLGIETIAEFVGSRPIFDELKNLGVDYAQGYWTGKPMPLPDLFKPDSVPPLPLAHKA